MTGINRAKLEQMAAELEKSEDFKVIRRLHLDTICSDIPVQELRDYGNVSVFLDCETTGLDVARDHVVEIAMVPFSYNDQGIITKVGRPLVQMNDPGIPIREEITRVTGITDEMVRDRSLNIDAIEEMATHADLIIAHNASFDRKHMERISKVFESKPWACSQTQIPWEDAGFQSKRLTELVFQYGYFFDAHRAENDCLAALSILNEELPGAGRSGFQALLDNANRKDYLVRAVGAAFAKKDLLKERKYLWDAQAKVWWREVSEQDLPEEMEWLGRAVYGRPVPDSFRLHEIDATVRFSNRLSSDMQRIAPWGSVRDGRAPKEQQEFAFTP